MVGRDHASVARGCIALKFPTEVSEKALNQLDSDLKPFCQNWKLAYQLLRTQKAMLDSSGGVSW